MEKPFLILFMKDEQEIVAQKIRLANEMFKVIAIDVNSNDGTPNMAKVGKARLILASDEKDGLRKALRLLVFYEPRHTCLSSCQQYTGHLGKLLKENIGVHYGPLLNKNVWNTSVSLEKVPVITNNFKKLISGTSRKKL